MNSAILGEKTHRLGLGECRHESSFEAGRQAAAQAHSNLAGESTAAWALAFAGGSHDPEQLMAGLRSELGNLPIVGGSAVGTISHATCSYQGDECSVTLFPDTLPAPTILAQDGLEEDEKYAGLRLGANIRKQCRDGQTALLFYDSIHSVPPLVLHVGSRLTEGIQAGLAGRDISLIGAGLVGNLGFDKSFLFNGQEGVRHAAVAVILPPDVRSRTQIMHGCSPISETMEITRIDGAEVFELNGRRALDVLTELLGPHDDEDHIQCLSLNLTLGEKLGFPFSEFKESNYVNRLIVTGDPDTGSVTLFEADFHHGSRVQVMARDNAMMVNSVRERTRELLTHLDGNDPFLGFYIDCAGRSRAFSGADVEEAEILAQEVGTSIPLTGFYSGVEIAPVNRRSRPLDWTGVLTLLTIDDT